MREQPGPGAVRLASVIAPSVGLGMRIMLDADINGREHLPAEGPYIVTANHLSLVDPVLVSAAVGRLVRFLALDELFGQHKTLDRLMLYFGAIPLSRDRPPLGALRRALAVLDADDILGIFPEGARALHWGERTIKRGAAWLAIGTSAPIVPVSIIGTEATLSLAEPGLRVPSVKLTIHPPLDPASYIDRVDPLGSMMSDWADVIDRGIRHWKHGSR